MYVIDICFNSIKQKFKQFSSLYMNYLRGCCTSCSRKINFHAYVKRFALSGMGPTQFQYYSYFQLIVQER